MNSVISRISISLDGFGAGPDQSIDEPLGKGGERLHEWYIENRARALQVIERFEQDVGAYIMGRNMFGPVRGDWPDQSWRGWWGEEPPYHTPVFVLTHHARDPAPMEGGTTFNFVTDGIEAALTQAREAAGEKDVVIAGGASVIRQYLNAGLVDELLLHVSPIVLGAGERLLDGVGDLLLEPAEVTAAPGVTHIRYKVGGS